jgi:serralysin
MLGGSGNDKVRGGQGKDSLSGCSGNDVISGDRGNESGGSGADMFRDSQDTGIDRVLDFHCAEGGRVMLDPGVTYTAGRVGEDTVDMGGGDQMILVGVPLSSPPSDRIFLGQAVRAIAPPA